MAAGAAVLGWARPAHATASIFDPVPSPSAAGWSQEGSEPFTEATPLVINDGNAVSSGSTPQPFCTFFVADNPAFAQDLKLQPNVTVDPGFIPDPEGNTGVHVTLNDGFREIRAVLKQGPAGLKVALVGYAGFSTGVDVGALGGQFGLTRRAADGAAVLSAGSQTETILAVDQPGSQRPGVMTIEFGTYGIPTSSVSRWQTLGFPLPSVSFASFAARAQINLRSGAANDWFAIEALFRPGAASNGLDPLTEPVTLALGTGSWTIPAGEFRASRVGTFVFHGIVGTTVLEVALQRFRRGIWGLGVWGNGADLAGTANPVAVRLAIGDDAGATEVLAYFV